MSLVTVICHFPVENLWVEEALLGSRSSIEFGGYTCTLALPANTSDFGIGGELKGMMLLGGWVEEGGQRTKSAVKLLRVEVELPSDLTADRFSGTEWPAGLEEQALMTLDRGTKVARDVATQYVRWVRVASGQSWLGPSTLKLSPTWVSNMLDAQGRSIPLGYRFGGGLVRVFNRQPALTVNDHDAALRAVLGGIEPPLAEMLLADAQHATRDQVHPDVRMGVLLAAIACEVRVKEVVAAVAHPLQRGMIEVITKYHNDVSVPVFLQFHLVLKAVCGRSLSEENPPLFKRVQKLFIDRNKVAHMGGKSLKEGEDLSKHLDTAREAFAWLDDVLANHEHPGEVSLTED